MDNQISNPGSFMSPAGGGGDAVIEAMSRRGMQGGGALNQNTQNPSALPPTPPQGSAPAPSGAPSGMPMGAAPVGPNEAEIILRALDTRLKSDSKIKEAQAGIR